MTDIAYKPATELVADIKAGRIGAQELLEHYLARIEAYDGAINAVVVRDFERARERARLSDEALARGEDWGALHGLPTLVVAMIASAAAHLEELDGPWPARS